MKHGDIGIDSSLKRIAWHYGVAKKGSEHEATMRALLVRKVLSLPDSPGPRRSTDPARVDT